MSGNRNISFYLGPEHMAMLDAICGDKRKRACTVKQWLLTALEEDAVERGMAPSAMERLERDAA